MLEIFFFHLYAQNSLSIWRNLSLFLLECWRIPAMRAEMPRNYLISGLFPLPHEDIVTSVECSAHPPSLFPEKMYSF
jgi:hypothetical protein